MAMSQYSLEQCAGKNSDTESCKDIELKAKEIGEEYDLSLYCSRALVRQCSYERLHLRYPPYSTIGKLDREEQSKLIKIIVKEGLSYVISKLEGISKKRKVTELKNTIRQYFRPKTQVEAIRELMFGG